MKPLRLLTSETAELQTAQVSINTLTVSGRQVTLAVFRQLLEEPIIDIETFTLRGIPWGHVRYLVERSHQSAINVVWQLGSELRRCEVSRKWAPDYGGWLPITEEKLRRRSGGVNVEVLDCYGFEKTIAFKQFTDPVWPADGEKDAEKRHEYYRACDEQRLARAHWRELETSRFVEFVNSEINADNISRQKAIARYNAITEPLFSLPQLFIAV